MKCVRRRFAVQKKEHGRIQKELDAANERFKEYERKDVKLREDIKHLQAKHKKLRDKLAKDSAKAQARSPAFPVPILVKPTLEWLPWSTTAS